MFCPLLTKEGNKGWLTKNTFPEQKDANNMLLLGIYPGMNPGLHLKIGLPASLRYAGQVSFTEVCPAFFNKASYRCGTVGELFSVIPGLTRGICVENAPRFHPDAFKVGTPTNASGQM